MSGIWEAPNPVITKDRSSGRYHERLRYKDRWFVDERCQTDQSGSYDVVEDFDLNVENGDLLCQYCFKHVV